MKGIDVANRFLKMYMINPKNVDMQKFYKAISKCILARNVNNRQMYVNALNDVYDALNVQKDKNGNIIPTPSKSKSFEDYLDLNDRHDYVHGQFTNDKHLENNADNKVAVHQEELNDESESLNPLHSLWQYNEDDDFQNFDEDEILDEYNQIKRKKIFEQLGHGENKQPSQKIIDEIKKNPQEMLHKYAKIQGLSDNEGRELLMRASNPNNTPSTVFERILKKELDLKENEKEYGLIGFTPNVYAKTNTSANYIKSPISVKPFDQEENYSETIKFCEEVLRLFDEGTYFPVHELNKVAKGILKQNIQLTLRAAERNLNMQHKQKQAETKAKGETTEDNTIKKMRKEYEDNLDYGALVEYWNPLRFYNSDIIDQETFNNIFNFNEQIGKTIPSKTFSKHNVDLILSKAASNLYDSYNMLKPEPELEVFEEESFNQELYNNNKFYKQTTDYISQIKEINPKWEKTLNDIAMIYTKQKTRYEKIADEVNIPPEIIAAIHYRESAKDFLNETFAVYLHNGDPLGQKSIKAPNPDLFQKGNFDKAAVDALRGWDGERYYKENRAKQLKLMSDSKDLTAMVTYAWLYNGWTQIEKASYVFNGTDIISSGHYTSDGIYESTSADENVGVYLILKKLLQS